ncbi:10 TM acyl transferase domain found in Cas1p-domain-containing protein [Geopyxis carbonaria]|nr:10 TM acyl transferase domain found in Cas1p-domain-containing protein [Geopyxis carbonaria]
MGRLTSLFAKPALDAHRVFSVFLFVTVFAVVLRYCFLDARDPSKCGALLNEGIWLDRPTNVSLSLPHGWQPPGCMVHSYQPKDASACLKDRRLVFAGDSQIRQVFWAVAKKLDKDVNTTMAQMHSDITVERKGVKLQFLWDPYLNGSAVQTELKLFNGGKGAAEDPKRPAILLMGTGLWYSRFESVNALKKWRDTIDGIASQMRVGRTTTDLTRQDLCLLAPVPVPAWAKLNDERKKTITPKQISEMNAYLQQLSDIHGVDVAWSFSAMTKGLPRTYESSGIHVEPEIVAQQADTLLNLRCNAARPPAYPYDNTCCNKYQPPNWQQWAGLFFVLAALPAMSLLRSRAEGRGQQPASWIPSERTTHALLVFGLAVVYCFYADRTQVFNKSHKHYSTLQFLALSLAALALGFGTIKHSSATATDQPFLFRDQTDEWKGWMQFAILIYHYTGASKVAAIYGFIRITVAAYLFMTGYGHTLYFYKKRDFSFKRVAGVLIRLNLLSCVLPYMMKTDYIFYYFAPLVSFWFLVVYATMRVGAKYNGNAAFLLVKIVVSALLVTAFTKTPGILEAVFNIPHLLAGTEWSVTEWRFRVFLDMWIVYIGMLTALLFLHLSTPTAPLSPALRKGALIAALIALPCFFLFQTTRETKYVYNAYHPYISWIPILSFIALRNATPRLRNAYSGAFAWLGRCSLETFTLQFHIWMAADTHGLLDLGIFGPYARVSNFVIATVMFVYVSNSVAGATGELTAWIMGAEKKPTPPPAQAQTLPVTSADVHVESKGGSAEESVRLQQFGESSSAAAAAQEKAPQEGKLALYWKNLKLRCVVILLGMWVLNLVCPDSDSGY